MIKSKARNLQTTIMLDYSDPTNPQPKTIELGIPIETLNFEFFAFAGLVVGSVIAFFTLRQKKRTDQLPTANTRFAAMLADE